MAISLESPICGVNKAAPIQPARPGACGADAANGACGATFFGARLRAPKSAAP